MHSKIFQITETRVDRDNYLNEDTLEQGRAVKFYLKYLIVL